MLGKLRTPICDGKIEIDHEKELQDKHAGYAEVENIAIFDEAQRSWDQEHLSAWLKRKKGFNDFPMSEGEFLIWSLDQRKDWAVIVCLVGGGQEINTGEAGIGEWIRAVRDTFPKWNVYISNQLTEKEYAEGQVVNMLANHNNVEFSSDLHLAVSMRSFRAESLSRMVHYLLEDAASEFDVQGLELDWTCLVWDGDFRFIDGGWDYYEFNGGNRWNRIKKPERQAYQLNAYRVLLTRARQGMVICVPEGDSADQTRLPEFYDGTYNYLKSLGFSEL